MSTKQLLKSTKVVQAITPTAGAAGATDIEGTTLDMSGFEGVVAPRRPAPLLLAP